MSKLLSLSGSCEWKCVDILYQPIKVNGLKGRWNLCGNGPPINSKVSALGEFHSTWPYI
jgi:hypothetical protein